MTKYLLPIDLEAVEQTLERYGTLHQNDTKRIVQELREAREKIAKVTEYAENSYCMCEYVTEGNTCDICVIRQALSEGLPV